jgi:hypothetical protein
VIGGRVQTKRTRQIPRTAGRWTDDLKRASKRLQRLTSASLKLLTATTQKSGKLPWMPSLLLRHLSLHLYELRFHTSLPYHHLLLRLSYLHFEQGVTLGHALLSIPLCLTFSALFIQALDRVPCITNVFSTFPVRDSYESFYLPFRLSRSLVPPHSSLHHVTKIPHLFTQWNTSESNISFDASDALSAVGCSCLCIHHALIQRLRRFSRVRCFRDQEFGSSTEFSC